MTRGSEAQTALRKDLARTLGIDPSAHPRPEVLWEYQEGLLGEVEQEEIRDHLTVCPACARQVLELSGAVEPEVPDEEEAHQPLSDGRMAELWPKMRAELPLEVPQRLETPKVLSWRRRAETIALPLAAVLALAVVALAGWGRSLARRGGEGEPVANVAVISAVPVGEESRVRGVEEKSTLPAAAGGVLVRLALAEPRKFSRYQVAVTSVSSPLVEWNSDALHRETTGVLAFQLPPRFFGRMYKINLTGLDAEGRSTPLASYMVDLHTSL